MSSVETITNPTVCILMIAVKPSWRMTYLLQLGTCQDRGDCLLIIYCVCAVKCTHIVLIITGIQQTYHILIPCLTSIVGLLVQVLLILSPWLSVPQALFILILI